MSIASDFKEERAHVRALAALVEHVGPCGDCAERVRRNACTGCGRPTPRPEMSGSGGVRLCGDCTTRQLEEAMTLRMPGEPAPEVVPPASRPPAAPVIDLSDPGLPLCARGEELRAAALEARAALPAERLIIFYGLEARPREEGFDADYDLDAIPPVDAHDCARAAAWLRGDPGEARAILDTVVERAGPLEEREGSTAEHREAFLKGFRQRFPSRGPAPTEEVKARRAAAADRLVAIIAERYSNRHGGLPPDDALAEYRRGYDLWIMGDGPGDLEKMVEKAEEFKRDHARTWGLKALLRPKDPLAELKKIARWIAEGLIREESEKG